jgi:hypothetical protein
MDEDEDQRGDEEEQWNGVNKTTSEQARHGLQLI